ncbi:MAG TPA: glycosyltransferase [Casimicrobiaceae bacterium]|nr:glycosyltransferase [Casimicrobiaceae bacterium]
MKDARIAVVHDWLDTWGGGESVLAEILRAYPQGELFALVDFFSDGLRARIGGRRARTTFLQRMPGARKHFRGYLPLFPRAIESLDLAAYDVILSTSHAVAKGVLTRPSQLHVCYCHTPMRYAWDLREQYLGQRGLATGVRGLVVNHLLDRLRDWDRASSARVTEFVANSSYVRGRIARCYGRDATVIPPPVDTDFFTPAAPAPARDYYLAASRWVPYKRGELVAAAFRALPEHRLVIAGDGPEGARIRAAMGGNAQWMGLVSRERMRDLLRGARAFVFAAEEDFGILPVEAQACGTPVIVYGRGGARETVRDGATGLFFDTQSAEAIADAVRRFEALVPGPDPADCRAQALAFAAPRFTADYTALVERAWGARKAAGDNRAPWPAAS